MSWLIRQTILVSFIVAALCVAVAAQQGRETTNDRARPVATARAQTNAVAANVDENFELNISERRITEHDFFASTAIAAGDEQARGLNLRVGVAVGASEIDVLLRNVHGRVRFRASLEALRRVLDARRASVATPEPPSIP